jgi:hypothetical protein
MKLTHKEYLERILRDKKMELKNTEVQYQIEIAKYNTKHDMLQKEIDSIETQLNDNKE